MSIADTLNTRLLEAHPAAHHFLSPLGKRMFFPKGIPVQAAEARGAEYNATIGQITDGHGRALPPAAMTQHTRAFNPNDVYLYSSVGGDVRLREAWQRRILSRGEVPATLPAVTSGLTHGLSMLADLFIDDNTTLWVPTPGWGNYRLIFSTRRGAQMRGYKVIEDGAPTIAGLEEAMANPTGRDVLLLNFPGNPTGYTPTAEEARRIVSLIRNHPGPLMVICDDAYQDMVFEDGLMPRSIYYELADLPKETHFVVKVDGATKELLFFGGRVGFLTFACDGDAAAVIEEKIRGQLRGTVNVPPGLPQALVRAALDDDGLEGQLQEVFGILGERYRALKAALGRHGVPYIPFNSGCFALIPTDTDPSQLRKTLLSEGVGLVACGDISAIRIAYCGVAEDQIDGLVAGIARHVG